MDIKVAETQHLFVVENQVANTLAEHFGLRDTRDLPSYYQPTHEAREVAQGVLDLAIEPNSSVEILFYDEGVCLTGIAGVIGPDNLGEMVGDTEGPASFLWDRGSVDLHYYQLNNEE